MEYSTTIEINFTDSGLEISEDALSCISDFDVTATVVPNTYDGWSITDINVRKMKIVNSSIEYTDEPLGGNFLIAVRTYLKEAHSLRINNEWVHFGD
jgi:hypothetical protein